jgi:2-C-methyl-D-erythritol 2,4-cyclodiphosphate synthase
MESQVRREGAVVRVGIGYDLHRLEPGRRLVLGSLEVEFDRGLVGHSDGDVVLHAVIDALLGAAGLPDIGEQFPDTDPVYKDADSAVLLKQAVDLVRRRGFEPANVDLVIHAEKPKLSTYKAPMAAAIAGLIGRPPDDVNVKAKTQEGLGEIGESRAIACTAVALVVPVED